MPIFGHPVHENGVNEAEPIINFWHNLLLTLQTERQADEMN